MRTMQARQVGEAWPTSNMHPSRTLLHPTTLLPKPGTSLIRNLMAPPRLHQPKLGDAHRQDLHMLKLREVRRRRRRLLIALHPRSRRARRRLRQAVHGTVYGGRSPIRIASLSRRTPLGRSRTAIRRGSRREGRATTSASRPRTGRSSWPRSKRSGILMPCWRGRGRAKIRRTMARIGDCYKRLRRNTVGGKC